MNASIAKPPWLLETNPWQKTSYIELPASLTFTAWQKVDSTELIGAKMQISTLEDEGRWELVKKMANPYEIVYTHEDKKFHPSISLVKPLSRSYFKMIEILHVLQFFEQLPKQQTRIRSAHVAEGPGGFIQALLQACERRKITLQRATAMTLKPNNPCVPGWKRAAAFLHRNTQVIIHHGEDSTGDIYKAVNRNSFIAASRPGVSLFTADGGFDFSINYDIQEERVFHLLVSSITTGIQTLALDGCFVIKLFDILSEHTQLLIVLLSQCFREWILYKPALSRPCNSERYFLGRGNRIHSPTVLAHLLAIQENAAKGLYPTGISSCSTEAVRDYIRRHIEQTTEEQIRSISHALKYANQPELWYSTQLPIDLKKSIAWCEKFHVPYLAPG
jgi:23S rRNA U2552 (ribose-2'-O)-methylase RlmE/FtsJ